MAYKYRFQAQYFFQTFIPFDVKINNRYDDEPSYGSISSKMAQLTSENKKLREALKKSEHEKKFLLEALKPE